ncbi:hypothetical protein MKK67_16800 [Methylobacterium sp. J-072]|uniref:hypothetical protein n=1 Tax=Methylobacterium sp. J-072 TaxID=2836651 RepID=UPI001FBBFD4E|nr:hypothetical protein [Methylobacterium sp. J-072]MCJ2094138.1 hypothetical protein [Methylobacterium sp. J-072]
MPTPSKLGMCDHVFQKSVAPPAAQQIRCDDEGAGGREAVVIIGHGDGDTQLRHRLPPDALGLLIGSGGTADFGRFE